MREHVVVLRRRRSPPEWLKLLSAGYWIGLPVRARNGRSYWSVRPCRWRYWPAGFQGTQDNGGER